jgi:hypothetical protein
LSRPIAEKNLNFISGRRIDLTPFGGRLGALSSLTGVLKGANFVDVVLAHANLFPPAIGPPDLSLWYTRGKVF